MTQEGTKRKLAAILSADVKEYSRLMSQDERGTIRTLTAYKEAMSSLIEEYKGRVVDAPGDNLLAEFGSVLDAVNCAVEIQRELAERNAELPRARQMEFRIGINLGDIVVEERRIYGDGVNIAARVESLAEGGGICIAGTVHDHVKNKLGLEYEYLGEQAVKNIPEPVHVYRVLSFPGAAAHRVVKAKEKEGRKWRKAATAVALVLIVGAAAAAVWNFYLRPRAPAVEPASVERMAHPLPDKPSIAVLPFENLSGDPKQEYLSDGISEAIISTLSKVPRLFVIARNSTFTYKGKPVKVQQVAEELGVQYVLEGSVQRSGEKLRVAVQLVDALKGHHLWSERYDLKMDDLLAVQDKIAMNVLVETQVKLTEGEQARLLKRETNNLKAYEKYLEASKYYYRTNREDMFKARQLFEEAVRLDPDFSGAYRMIGATHLWDAARRWSQDPDKSWQLATEYARKALALDENNFGNLQFWSAIVQGNGDHEKAIEISRRALKMNPNYAGAYEMLAGVLFNAGRYEEAIPLHEKAGRLNPFPPAKYYRNSGLYYWFAGRYEDAIAASKKALHLNPDDITTFRNLVAIYATIEQEEEARAAAAEVLRLDPSFTIEREFKNMGWKDREGMERYMDALRKAGLPER
jgi:TolB-like protein/class 3 adenylate cyclase